MCTSAKPTPCAFSCMAASCHHQMSSTCLNQTTRPILSDPFLRLDGFCPGKIMLDEKVVVATQMMLSHCQATLRPRYQRNFFTALEIFGESSKGADWLQVGLVVVLYELFSTMEQAMKSLSE